MNTFEVAVLRILIKRQQPLKLSTLVSGFPDDCEDSVLSAISSLKLYGYVTLDDYRPSGYISISRERRKEILEIVDSAIYSHKFEAQPSKENYSSSNSSANLKKKESFGQVTAKYPIFQEIRATAAVSSLFIVGLVIALGSSMPTTSPDTEFITYYEFMPPYKKWSGAYSGDDRDTKNPDYAYAPAHTSFVTWKDYCSSQKLAHHQT